MNMRWELFYPLYTIKLQVLVVTKSVEFECVVSENPEQGGMHLEYFEI